jgi:hypothetical protein
VRLVLGQHHRAFRQPVKLLAQVGEDLVAVGVALGDQAGPPPAGDLADAPVQGALADRRSPEPHVQPTDRPGARGGQQPADALAQPGAAQPGSAAAGPVGKTADAVLLVAVDPAAHGAGVVAEQLGDLGGVPAACRQQDHDQPGRYPPAAMQDAEQVRVGIGGDSGVDAGRRKIGTSLVWLLWKVTHEATSLPGRPSPRVTDTTSGHPL